MDMFKKAVDKITGGDGDVDASDVMNAAGNLADFKNLDLGALGVSDLDGFKEALGGFDITKVAGLNFPISKVDLAVFLKGAGAPDIVSKAVNMLPDGIIDSLNDLRKMLPL